MIFRRLFKRTPTPPDDYERTIRQMAGAETPEERARLLELALTQTKRAVGANTNAAQVEVWAMEGRLAERLDLKFGATNEMLADLVDHSRTSASGIGELQRGQLALGDMFQQIGERVTGVEITQGEQGTEIVNLRSRVDRHDTIIQDFYGSRDESKRRHDKNEQMLKELTDTINRIEENQKKLLGKG